MGEISSQAIVTMHYHVLYDSEMPRAIFAIGNMMDSEGSRKLQILILSEIVHMEFVSISMISSGVSQNIRMRSERKLVMFMMYFPDSSENLIQLQDLEYGNETIRMILELDRSEHSLVS